MTADERRKRLAKARLYGIADFGYIKGLDMERAAKGLLEGGVDLLQLRGKGIPEEEIGESAERLIPMCRKAGVPFVLNDFPELARKLGADGVHIGQEDGGMAEAREIVGGGMLIGRSTHGMDQAKRALVEGADYIGFGPLYPTPTKQGRRAIGLEEIAHMEEVVGGRVPAFCIGGIAPGNLQDVLAAGGRRFVVVSYLLKAADIRIATAGLKWDIPEIG